MSCDCNCGCDGKYSDGYLCYPLVIRVSYPSRVEIKCEENGETHGSGIHPYIKSTENCWSLFNKSEDGSTTYIFGIRVPSNGDKCNKSGSANARVEISVNSPKFGWHSEDKEEIDKKFTIWDGSNPDVSVHLEARRKNFSDSDSYTFQQMPNSNINNHLGRVRAGLFVITVDTAGNVSVMSKAEVFGENTYDDVW